MITKVSDDVLRSLIAQHRAGDATAGELLADALEGNGHDPKQVELLRDHLSGDGLPVRVVDEPLRVEHDLDAIAANADGLDEDLRGQAVAAGVAVVPDVEVEVGDVQDWRDDWRGGEGGSWPTYELVIHVDGCAAPVTVAGWNFVGMMGPDGNRRHEEWDQDTSDGTYSGLPECEGGVVQTTNGGSWALPERTDAGLVCLYDDQAVNDAIQAAVRGVDHGPEPSIDELDNDEHGEDYSSVWVVRDWQVVEVPVRRLTALQNGGSSNRLIRDDPPTYLLEGYAVVDGDDVSATHATAEEAIADADPTGDDGERYATRGEAQAALDAQVDARLDELDDPDDAEHGRDVVGVYLVGTDDGDESERVYYDADDLRTICTDGWDVLLDSRLADHMSYFGLTAAMIVGAVPALVESALSDSTIQPILADALEENGYTGSYYLSRLRRSDDSSLISTLSEYLSRRDIDSGVGS